MITLREISADNFEECLCLSVAEDQKKHVASNAYSLAEAVVLSCSQDNIAARNLYTSLGFADSGYLDEDGDAYYRLELK